MTDVTGVLHRLGQSRALEEFAQALADTANEVSETGTPGRVTMTVEVRPTGQVGEPMVSMLERIKRVSPSKQPRGAFLFALGGELFVRDPRQPELPVRVVPEAQPLVRDEPDQAITREVTR
jgi:hypothetical protein